MTGKPYFILRTRAAEHDLEEIADAIALDSPLHAARLVAKIREGMGHLAHLPLRGARAPEGVVNGHITRQLVISNYRVIYLVTGHMVIVIGVRHVRRLPLA